MLKAYLATFYAVSGKFTSFIVNPVRSTHVLPALSTVLISQLGKLCNV